MSRVYNVRTKDGKPPRQWVCPRKNTPQTNVANVYWHKRDNRWAVERIDPVRERLVHVCYSKTFDEACTAREKAQLGEGGFGPGELVFDKMGQAIVKCGKCRLWFPLTAYAPEPCKYKKEFKKFADACVDLGGDDERKAGEAERLLSMMPTSKGKRTALRRSQCRQCRDIAHRTTFEGPDSARSKCRNASIAIREDMARNGCQECSEDRAECLECEHKNREGKPKGCPGIMRYDWFSNKHKHNGPAEMWKAYRNPNVVVLCMCCHLLQPTHGTFHGANASTLEEGSQKRLFREYRDKKKEHNNKRKREFVNTSDNGDEFLPGQCYYCDYVCEKGNETAMSWMHREEENKNNGISMIVGSNISDKTGIALIDAEIDGSSGSGGCALGCANCHHYYETLPRAKEGTEKWDSLVERPVKKRIM